MVMDISKSDSEKKWYWRKRDSDERNGPVSTQKLLKLAKTGDLRTEDLVWKDGMSDWRKAKSVSTLSMQDILKEPESEESKWDGYYRYLGHFFYPARVLGPLLERVLYPIAYVSFFIPFGISKNYQKTVKEASKFSSYASAYLANIFIPVILISGILIPEGKRGRAVEACENKVREENNVVQLFGGSNPMIGGVADESSSYPGSVFDIGNGEYRVEGFVSTKRIASDETYGDLYKGSHFQCTVKVTEKETKVTSFLD